MIFTTRTSVWDRACAVSGWTAACVFVVSDGIALTSPGYLHGSRNYATRRLHAANK